MSILHALRVSASGLTAQRVRMDVIANNVANAETTRTADGGPYRRELVRFLPRGATPFSLVLDRFRGASGPAYDGVEVTAVFQDDTPPRLVYDPTHPDADAAGYVAYPNVNPVVEMVDLLAATRAYQANVTVLNAAKQMALKALEIGK
ncbi:MAG: flagellar basal body rod protein FlgC [Chloroflexota bacterium]|nr:flagellar basal body rod protein FlgC [Dehalococcoidia bacterium]MDW8254462.1 flagellar basal body rod protein FlgC [Chloroflexota bacterium]